MGTETNGPCLRCIAGVLVGGGSKRMGRAKAVLTLPDGRTLVEHAVGITQSLQPVVEETVILGAVDCLPPAVGMVRRLPDPVVDAGPLAGLIALLDYAADRWSLLLSCDMPLLAAPVLRRLLAEVHPDADAVAFMQSDRPRTYHACCALYHPRTRGAADGGMSVGRRSLQRVLAEVRTRALQPTPDEARQLTNVNTPAEHERAMRSIQP